MDCPVCGGPGGFLGVLGSLAHFTCRDCGAGFNCNADELSFEEDDVEDEDWPDDEFDEFTTGPRLE